MDIREHLRREASGGQAPDDTRALMAEQLEAHEPGVETENN